VLILKILRFSTPTLRYSTIIMSVNPSMFFPFCGHLTPANGGTRLQFGEASFRPNCHVIRCEHCQQLIPTTSIVAPPHRPTARSQHITVDPQLIRTHTTQSPPVSVTSDYRQHQFGDLDRRWQGNSGIISFCWMLGFLLRFWFLYLVTAYTHVA